MDRCVGAAARLPESDRKDLAIQALARSETVSDLAARHRASRKFAYQQTHNAVAALDGAFMSATPDDEVLFALTVTKTWLRQVIVGLTLICHSSYRGVVEFLRDLLGFSISVGTVHHSRPRGRRTSSTGSRTCQAFGWACTTRSSTVPRPCWPASMPTRPIATYWLRSSVATPTAGACICSTLPSRGLILTIRSAGAGQGLRAGQKAAWGDTPCHGDVFHIQR